MGEALHSLEEGGGAILSPGPVPAGRAAVGEDEEPGDGAFRHERDGIGRRRGRLAAGPRQLPVGVVELALRATGAVDDDLVVVVVLDID